MDKIIFVSNWTQGTGMSGGDRIWIEFAKIWKSKLEISIVGSQEAIEISKRYGLSDVEFIQSVESVDTKDNLSVKGLIVNMIARTVKSSLFARKNNEKIIGDSEKTYIYSVSDFWPDSLPAFLLKLKNPRAIWIAGFYLFAPAPWQKDSPYKGKHFIKGLFYWIIQLPMYWMVKKFADIVFVTSEPDVSKFETRKRSRDDIVVIQGGVDVSDANKYFDSGESVSWDQKKYDACFLGRLHHQKGVMGLIDIWKKVCDKKPEAKLAIIGDGELEGALNDKIEKLDLKENIDMLGFMDGEEKYEVFKRSKIMVHPATYDSGGMAAAEGMAWGLPGVSFDLEALNTYYPKGMKKTEQEDVDGFAENVLEVISDKELYESLSKDARDLVLEVWDWKKRAERIFGKTFNN
jgi:glycosyltransferase involved in cell wall biosynthesis